ncbi:hypothetical protein [Levilactobacillus lindianensis]|uniref:hypothetical protein n=1 Tax=Levilactobacillus lindianensis TaxID=2486018 RepID=UPI000F73DC76|nr:hypothetical protein [Levilactobacillus lindianensis]
MESFTYYVKKGDNNRVAEQPVTATADGLAPVTMADYEKEYFLQYWDQYYWDANGDLQSPEDLPSHSTAMLRLTISNQASQISDLLTDNKQLKQDKEQLSKQLTTANSTIEQLQKMVGELTAQAITYQATISDLQQLVGQLTAQIVQLQAEKNTDTTKEA